MSEFGVSVMNEKIRSEHICCWHSGHHIYALNVWKVGSERIKHLSFLLMAGQHILNWKMVETTIIPSLQFSKSI